MSQGSGIDLCKKVAWTDRDSLSNRVSVRQIEFLQERGESRVVVQALQ